MLICKCWAVKVQVISQQLHWKLVVLQLIARAVLTH